MTSGAARAPSPTSPHASILLTCAQACTLAITHCRQHANPSSTLTHARACTQGVLSKDLAHWGDDADAQRLQRSQVARSEGAVPHEGVHGGRHQQRPVKVPRPHLPRMLTSSGQNLSIALDSAELWREAAFDRETLGSSLGLRDHAKETCRLIPKAASDRDTLGKSATWSMQDAPIFRDKLSPLPRRSADCRTGPARAWPACWPTAARPPGSPPSAAAQCA